MVDLERKGRRFDTRQRHCTVVSWAIHYILSYICKYWWVMPQSHTHLRTLRMVRKARPQLSVHTVTIRITSAENVTVHYIIRNLPQVHFYPRPNFEKYQKSSADENNAMMRNARQEYVITRILSVSHSHLNVPKPIIQQSTQRCGLVRFHSGRYL